MAKTPSDRCAELIKRTNALMAGADVQHVCEVYGRFALQWIGRIEFSCADADPSQIDASLRNPSNPAMTLRMAASTMLLGAKHNALAPHTIPVLKLVASEARRLGLMDDFKPTATARVPFDLFCGCIFHILTSLGLPARDYDVRMIAQMSVPTLWARATFDDHICQNPNLEHLRLINLGAAGTDLQQCCELDPEIAIREAIKYIEEHLIKSQLPKRIVSTIRKTIKEFVREATHEPGLGQVST